MINYQFVPMSTDVLISGQTQHYIPSTAYTEAGKQLTDKDVKIFDLSNYMNWTSFEHFNEAMLNMLCIIGLAIRLKIVEPPSAARSIPLGQKLKPGSPKKLTLPL